MSDSFHPAGNLRRKHTHTPTHTYTHLRRLADHMIAEATHLGVQDSVGEKPAVCKSHCVFDLCHCLCQPGGVSLDSVIS